MSELEGQEGRAFRASQGRKCARWPAMLWAERRIFGSCRGGQVLETQEQTSVIISDTVSGQLSVWALTQCECDGEAFTRLTHGPGQPDGRGGAWGDACWG